MDAALLLNSTNNAEFRLTNTYTLSAAARMGESSRLKQGSSSSGFLLTDLAGDNPQKLRGRSWRWV
ncbi:hypothetical protein LEP1GSC021_2924 [Leptospira noguchii str. 1993005606]|nr:hypothetical protein LEP1GSC021_2924 [Leptospira noguchii str. 1993005606]